jgi:GlpG protein
MQIANAAHFFGLAFGVCVAALFVLQWRPSLPAAGLVLLLGVSFVPLQWCPLSADWTALEAIHADRQKDYPAAIALYRRSLELGSDPAWVWASLAAIYATEQNESEYVKAVQELRKIDPELARGLATDLGTPK